MQKRRSQFGFTLLELMIVVTIMVILMTIGVPSFRTLYQNNRQTLMTNEMVGSLQLARSESIKRGQTVTVCRVADPTIAEPVCGSGSNWSSGWIVFADDAAAVGTFEVATDTIIQRNQGVQEGQNLIGNNNVAVRVSFNEVGLAQGTNGTMTLCDQRGTENSGSHTREIVISTTGRVRSSEGNGATSCP